MSDFVDAHAGDVAAGDVAAYDANCEAMQGPHAPCADCHELTPAAELTVCTDDEMRCSECMQRIEDAHDIAESLRVDAHIDSRRGL